MLWIRDFELELHSVLLPPKGQGSSLRTPRAGRVGERGGQAAKSGAFGDAPRDVI